MVTVAMWETQWDDKTKEEESKKEEEAPPVSFTDPVKGSVLSFCPVLNSERGMYYCVNGEPRPPFTRIVLSSHQKGPRLEFPELRTAATVPWECSEKILTDLAALAEARTVTHNIPAGGVVPKSKPSEAKRPARTEDTSKAVSYVETDGATASLPRGMVGQLLTATFGDGYKQVSVVANIASRLYQGGFSPFVVNAQSLQVVDPAPGGPKKLEITYVPQPALPVNTPPFQTQQQQQFQVPQTPPLPSPMSRFAPTSPGVPGVEGAAVYPTHSSSQLQRTLSREGDEDDANTDKGSTASYRHDPYNAMYTDDRSDATSLTNSTRRNSELTQEDIARYAIPQNRPGRANVSAQHGETLVVPPGTMARVVRAVYGQGDRWVLATNACKRAFSNGGIPGLRVTEDALGVADPCPGKQKTLVVVYRPIEEAHVAPLAAEGSGQLNSSGLGLSAGSPGSQQYATPY